MDRFSALSITQRLWLNLLIVTIFFTALGLSIYRGLSDIHSSAVNLSDIQHQESDAISHFQNNFSDTLLKMNIFILTQEAEVGQTFNQEIDDLKHLNQTLVDILAPEAINKMDQLLMNLKKTANSSVFLNKQVFENIEYGIEPTSETIKSLTQALSSHEDVETSTQILLLDINNRLIVSNNAMVRLISSSDLKYKREFDNNGLGDSAAPIFEQLEEVYASQFELQESYTELVSAWEGYEESFNDLKDSLVTTQKNNQTIADLTLQANLLMQDALTQSQTQTKQLIDEVSGLSNSKLQEVMLVVVLALLILLPITWVIIRSITHPMKQMQEKLNTIAHASQFSQWNMKTGPKELQQVNQSIALLLNTINNFNQEVIDVSSKLANGQLSASINNTYYGDLATLKQAFNQSVSKINTTFKRINKASQSLAKGEFSTTIETGKLQGDYQSVIQNLQTALHVQKETLYEINDIIQAMSQGEFHQRIQTDLPGEYNTIKQLLNQSMTLLDANLQAQNQTLSAFAQGNFKSEVNFENQGRLRELSQNMEQMATGISEMIKHVSEATNTSVCGIEEIRQGNQHLNTRVQEQASVVSRATQSMEQITHTIQSSLRDIQSVTDISESVHATVGGSNAVIEKMNQSMKTISEASSEIAAITDLIDGIAFQTNLLALNAAVEAARAGEAGRGFSVVAEEVRALAHKASEAAKEIRRVSNTSIENIEEGLALSQQSKLAFNDSCSSLEHVNQMIADMQTRMQNQAEEVTIVNDNLITIDQATQQNASLVHQVFTTSEQIKQQIHVLEKSISSFQVR